METPGELPERCRDRALKPSLVEWKRPGGAPGWSPGARSLETFLSGMETLQRPGIRDGEPALKPSLVEWKLADTAAVANSAKAALKPSLVEWKPVRRGRAAPRGRPLKPSLVEWKPISPNQRGRSASSLETFLSGMETSLERVVLRVRDRALKPSLVEWKLMREASRAATEPALNPS